MGRNGELGEASKQQEVDWWKIWSCKDKVDVLFFLCVGFFVPGSSRKPPEVFRVFKAFPAFSALCGTKDAEMSRHCDCRFCINHHGNETITCSTDRDRDARAEAVLSMALNIVAC